MSGTHNTNLRYYTKSYVSAPFSSYPLVIKHGPANHLIPSSFKGKMPMRRESEAGPSNWNLTAKPSNAVCSLTNLRALTPPLSTPRNTHSYQVQGEILFKDVQSSSNHLSSASNTSLESGVCTGTDGDDAQ